MTKKQASASSTQKGQIQILINVHTYVTKLTSSFKLNPEEKTGPFAVMTIHLKS